MNHTVQYERHPLSLAFADMAPEDFKALVEDVSVNGLREMGYLYEGKVLDGWHRMRACAIAGKIFRAEDYKGANPVGFVRSKNMHRRHLTASQRAATEVALSEWAVSGTNLKNLGTGAAAAPVATVADMAKAAQVSERTIQQAKVAQKAGLGEAVKEGKVSAEQAAELAKLAPEMRVAAVEAPPEKKRNAEPRVNKNKEIEKLLARVYQLETALEIERAKRDAVEDAETILRADAALTALESDTGKEILNLKRQIQVLIVVRDDYMNQCGDLRRYVKQLKRRLGR